MKAYGGGKTAPAADYKPRKDIGTVGGSKTAHLDLEDIGTTTNAQQPTRERECCFIS